MNDIDMTFDKWSFLASVAVRSSFWHYYSNIKCHSAGTTQRSTTLYSGLYRTRETSAGRSDYCLISNIRALPLHKTMTSIWRPFYEWRHEVEWIIARKTPVGVRVREALRDTFWRPPRLASKRTNNLEPGWKMIEASVQSMHNLHTYM